MKIVISHPDYGLTIPPKRTFNTRNVLCTLFIHPMIVSASDCMLSAHLQRENENALYYNLQSSLMDNEFERSLN